MRARVRGIYSTALTKLLLDHGFAIVQPSFTTRERFGLKECDESPDLDAYDRLDRQGVQAFGKAEFINTFCSMLQSRLDDVIVRRWAATADGIYKGLEAPATLWEGGSYVNVEFPALSKMKLDEFRGCVALTMNGHHFYKTCGMRVSSAIDMAEKMLEKGCCLKEVEDLFKQTVEAEFPIVGSVIGMEHVKLDGRVFHLGEALVEAFDRDRSRLRLSRVFERKGVYDGLGTMKEPGDRAVTEAKVGGWHFETQYFSREGRYKGTYVNLNTPIELYPHGIRYVDLEVDVCVWPNGTVRKLDEEKLEKAAAEGLVTEKLVKIVKEKLQELTVALYERK